MNIRAPRPHTSSRSIVCREAVGQPKKPSHQIYDPLRIKLPSPKQDVEADGCKILCCMCLCRIGYLSALPLNTQGDLRLQMVSMLQTAKRATSLELFRPRGALVEAGGGLLQRAGREIGAKEAKMGSRGGSEESRDRGLSGLGGGRGRELRSALSSSRLECSK